MIHHSVAAGVSASPDSRAKVRTPFQKGTFDVSCGKTPGGDPAQWRARLGHRPGRGQGGRISGFMP